MYFRSSKVQNNSNANNIYRIKVSHEYLGNFFCPSAIIERNKTNLKIRNSPNTIISKGETF